MRKIAILSIALTAACVAGFADCADLPVNRVVNVYHLTDTDLNEMMQGKHPGMAVEFSAQSTLPISFFLKGDLVNLIESEGDFGAVEVKQTFYARYVDGDLILSTNLADWKPFFEFITGNASIALMIQDGKPSIIFGSETNRRL
jgi:hypothetical protein